ncbi:MAG TPA: TetR/AcrR family transcriptional regulator [Planctomicrobium sp.]|nr:TetR/AcrR family transcriptional regulator [Planctomicrobium sp.]
MPPSDPVKRQSGETRQQLLSVAGETICNKGLAGITLEGVAKAAGVSKGGLLHHFPSKQHLIDAVIVDLHERFLEEMRELAKEDPVSTGRRVRAYLKVATRERDEQTNKLCSILAIEARDNPTLRNQWRDMISSLLRSGADEENTETDPITLAVVQLATDGLWLAELEGVFDNAPDLYTKIVERLEQMTR